MRSIDIHQEFPLKSTHRPARIAALVLMASAAGSAFGQVSRTPWQMNEGEGVIKLDAELPSNGALPENNYIAFKQAQVPAEGKGWVAAPNPETIGFGNASASKIAQAGGVCRKAVDYTYFQTFVEVPAGTRLDEFKISFQGMDDASRITIFNSKYPKGQIVAGSYVLRSAPNAQAATTDLKSLVTTGRNRVVITQVDWCPVGNQLQSAQVLLNGSKISTGGTTAVSRPVASGPFLPASHGDVHIRSLDGLTWDFQATGDYLLLKSADNQVMVQARQQAWPEKPSVSVNRAGAMRVGASKVEWYMLPKRVLYVNGKVTAMPASRTALPGGGAIETLRSGSKETLMVYWPNNSFVARMVAHSNNTMDLEVKKAVAPAGTYEGMIGNMDGNRGNDFQIRGGASLGTSMTSADIARVGESWRVRANESLFTQAHPDPKAAVAQTQPGIADLDPAARQQANQTCKAAGINDATALRHCTYDVAATGDKTFVESAKQFQQTVAALPKADRAGEKVEPASVQVPAGKPAAPAGKNIGLFLPGEKLKQGSRYGMSWHHIIFQQDGNLCIYKTAGNQFVWCVNNDPKVQYQRAKSVELTTDGRLRMTDAGGSVIWQTPANNPQVRSSVHLTDNGTLELRAPSGNVVWSSR